MHALLAWLYWNPPREAFTVPYINRPIAWYGLLFVSGFIAGYILLLFLFRRKIWNEKTLYPRDIANWAKVAQFFNQEGKPLQKHLKEEAKLSLRKLSLCQEPDKELKTSLLEALNQALQSPHEKLNRQELEARIPSGIAKAFDLAYFLTERMTWFVVAGTLIGSRLGHVFFYEWPRYQQNPIDILKIWEGGLASHGGAIGVIAALLLYRKSIRNQFPDFTFIDILDNVSIPAAFVAVCIRIGNFINQEITGPSTTVPWAVVFGDPVDGAANIPRHPTQLYEAACYLATFLFLWTFWYKKSEETRPGFIVGLFFIFVFGSRFFLEFLKMPMSLIFEETFLQTGQILSIPFIVAGFLLCRYGVRLKRIPAFS